MKVIETFSAQETFELGKKIAEEATKGQIFCLDGDLGTGKTVFTQGFARGLSIDGPVNSPTFTILQIYDDGRLPLYHFDVYRIEDPEELYEVGLDDYLYGDGVCLIEWASMISELIPGDAVHIKLEKQPEKGFDYRKITID